MKEEEEESVSEIRVYWKQIEHVSKLKYLKFVLDESSKHGAEYCRKVENKRKLFGGGDHIPSEC